MTEILEKLMPYIINNDIKESILLLQRKEIASAIVEINYYFPIKLTYYCNNNIIKKLFFTHQIVKIKEFPTIKYGEKEGKFFKEDSLYYTPDYYFIIAKKNSYSSYMGIPIMSVINCEILKSPTLFLSYDDFSSICTLPEEEKKFLYEKYIQSNYLIKGIETLNLRGIIYSNKIKNKEEKYYIKINENIYLSKEIFGIK
jgi:hypothetical protein